MKKIFFIAAVVMIMAVTTVLARSSSAHKSKSQEEGDTSRSPLIFEDEGLSSNELEARKIAETAHIKLRALSLQEKSDLDGVRKDKHLSKGDRIIAIKRIKKDYLEKEMILIHQRNNDIRKATSNKTGQ